MGGALGPSALFIYFSFFPLLPTEASLSPTVAEEKEEAPGQLGVRPPPTKKAIAHPHTSTHVEQKGLKEMQLKHEKKDFLLSP